MSKSLFNCISLIGIGLIGSSLARVIKRENLANEVKIATQSESTLRIAEKLNLGDQYFLDAEKAVVGADFVVLCIPVGAYESIAQNISKSLQRGAIITDVGSVKQSVISQVIPNIPDGVHFVPGHPVAGTEHSGPNAGFAELFENRWCILTPLKDTDKNAVESVKIFWEKCGSNIEIMDPEHHDLVLAITSHLPQLISYNIVGTADDLESVAESEVIKYSAAGFRDFTRLAASDPIMWRDVCLHNKEAILEILSRFSEDLSALRRAVRWGDGEALFDLFSRTRGIRRSIIAAGQESPAPNFGRDINQD